MQRRSVLFPEPLGPISATTSPLLSSKSMDFKTVMSPNRLLTASSRNTVLEKDELRASVGDAKDDSAFMVSPFD
jgi:hypothetical protein